MFNNIVVCNIINKSRLFILVVQLTENSGYKLNQTSSKLTCLQLQCMNFHPSWVIILPSHTPDINISTPKFLPCYLVFQGCAVAKPGGPWRLTFALWQPENLRFFMQIICWAPYILQFKLINNMSFGAGALKVEGPIVQKGSLAFEVTMATKRVQLSQSVNSNDLQ